MKNKAVIFFLVILLSFNTACYGPFNLTKKLYDWNGKVGDKFVNELVFFAFIVLPVYEVTLFIDGVVLNSIEFWTGSNPVAMNEDDIDVQLVNNDGNIYQITATKNKFHIVQLEGTGKGSEAEFIFNPEEESWYLLVNGESKKLLDSDSQKDLIEVFLPNGKSLSFNSNLTDKTIVQESIKDFTQYSFRK
jgi:hypothetical protein